MTNVDTAKLGQIYYSPKPIPEAAAPLGGNGDNPAHAPAHAPVQASNDYHESKQPITTKQQMYDYAWKVIYFSFVVIGVALIGYGIYSYLNNYFSNEKTEESPENSIDSQITNANNIGTDEGFEGYVVNFLGNQEDPIWL